jgi:phospholipid/cholesterol/gamma-HCH transport system substrate-binding protein
VAANSLGEEKSPAPGRGFTPARIAVVAALAVAVVALAVVLFGGNGGYKYDLLFQNAGQLVPENQVLVGGSPVGSVDSIELTENNLASVHVTASQQLHEGTTAVIRATSLSGVANHYVSVSPGPNSNPALEEGATLGLASTTTPVDIDQLFNTFPPGVRRGLSKFIQGNSEIYAGVGHEANQTYKYFGPALNRTTAFAHELNADQNLFQRFVVSSSRLVTAVSERGSQLSSAISNASTAFGAIAGQNVALDQTLRRLPPVLRQSNTTFVNLRAALDDLEPLIDTAKPATKNLAPFLAELRPVISKAVPVFENLRFTVRKPGKANDAGELLAALPAVQQRASKAFPHSEDAIAAFQPNLDFARAYTPDIFNGFGKVGQITGYYDGNGHYARASPTDLNLFDYNSGSGVLEPIAPSEQYDVFGSEANAPRRCPGGATQPAPDGSNPFVEPPWDGAGVTPSECNPADVPPGP